MENLRKANLYLRTFSWTKIPLIAFVNPKIVELDAEGVVVRVRKNWRTRNHFNSMYFGALAVGADITGAFLAFLKGKEHKVNAGIVFSDFHANFLKRPDSDVFFVCKNGSEIDAMIEESQRTGERITKPARIEAFTHYNKNQQELVAEMTLGLSIKVKA